MKNSHYHVCLSFIASALAMLGAGNASRAADAPLRAAGRKDLAVFEGPLAAMSPDIFGDKEKKEGLLRILTVDERMGCPRQNELVRVPLFFHEGECAGPNALRIRPAGGGNPLPYQADDVRRDAAGKVARMHLYFTVDLKLWERKQFHLLQIRGHDPISGRSEIGIVSPDLPVTEADGKVTLAGDDVKVTFHAQGELEGAIAGIETTVGKVTIPAQNFAPETRLIRQDKKLAKVRENAISFHANPAGVLVKDLCWGSGPLFAKLRLKIAPRDAPADIAEYIFIVPKHGSEFILTELFRPEEKDSPDTVGAAGNALLTGKIHLGGAPADQQLVSVPAGLRKELRTVFKYETKALVNAQSGISLSVIPYVQSGPNFAGIEPDGRVFFCGAQEFQTKAGSNSGSLRVFWGQARFIFSKATALEDLWRLSVRSFQPLTAVVDEPWATPEDFLALNRQVGEYFPKIQNWGRPFQAKLAQFYFLNQNSEALAALAKSPAERDLRLDRYLPTAEAVAAAAKKNQGAGAVDPWGLTYSTSMLVPLSEFIYPNERLDRHIALLAEASRLANGRAGEYGWPHVKSFANALNMHLGTYLMGVWGGRKRGNQDLVRWCLDAAQNQTIAGVYGHGQRPYTMNAGNADASDSLYQNNSDFWLRVLELCCNEDLSLHPSVYGRYLDAVDVNADLYQAKISDAGERVPAWWRATFHRTQSHDHRWEAWTCGPFLGMLADAPGGGRVGLTEACYFMQRDVGKAVGYNDLGYVFLAGVMLGKALPQYNPAPRPPLPANVQVKQDGGKNVVTWDEVKGDVAEYRVYRAEQIGGPWTWLNSPYKNMPAFVLPSDAERPRLPKPPKPAKKGEVPHEPEPAPPAPSVELNVPKIPDTLVKTASFTDPDGKTGSIYFVTAQDKDGRESRWFPDEPLPQPGKKLTPW